MTKLVVGLLALSAVGLGQVSPNGQSQFVCNNGNCTTSGMLSVGNVLLGPKTVGAGGNQLPAAVPANSGYVTVVTDSADCVTVGTGPSLCRSNGTVWSLLGGGGGVNGTNGNTILSGTSAPTGGNNGDFYLKTDTFCLYGPKTTVWPGSCTSLVGPAGPNGAQGLPGGNIGNWFPVNPPDFTGFSWVNQNTASWSVINGLPVVVFPYQSIVQWNNLVAPTLTVPYTITLVFTLTANVVGGDVGLTLQDSTTGKSINYLAYYANMQAAVFQETTSGVWSAESEPFSQVVSFGQIVGLRITDDGTHRSYWYSNDGGTAWIMLYQENTNTFLTPTKYGIVALSHLSGTTLNVTVWNLGVTTP